MCHHIQRNNCTFSHVGPLLAGKILTGRNSFCPASFLHDRSTVYTQKTNVLNLHITLFPNFKQFWYANITHKYAILTFYCVIIVLTQTCVIITYQIHFVLKFGNRFNTRIQHIIFLCVHVHCMYMYIKGPYLLCGFENSF
jgi:hypothetical protein